MISLELLLFFHRTWKTKNWKRKWSWLGFGKN